MRNFSLKDGYDSHGVPALSYHQPFTHAITSLIFSNGPLRHPHVLSDIHRNMSVFMNCAQTSKPSKLKPTKPLKRNLKLESHLFRKGNSIY
jgi:hypothetical protein